MAGRERGDAAAAEGGLVKSAQRILALLESFAAHRRPLRVGELAEALGWPQSSTSMLLKTLVSLGYVAFDPQARAFRPTFRVALLGDWIADTFPVEAGLTGMMEELGEITHDTVILGARSGVHVQYVHVIQARQPLRYHLPPGTRRLLPLANLGLALLSLDQDAEIERLVRRINAEGGGERPAFDLPAVLDKVRAVRRDGYSLVPNPVMPGATVLAMPLPSAGRLTPLALGLGGPTDRVTRSLEPLLAEMRRVIARHAPAG